MFRKTREKKRQIRNQAIAVTWLNAVVASATHQIDAGDLDFDDCLYRARDAALTLLDIFEPTD